MTNTSDVILEIHSHSQTVELKTFVLEKGLKIKSISSKKRNNMIDYEDQNQYNHYCQKNNTIFIGRERQIQQIGNWIKIEDGSVSRKHCKIQYKQSQMNPLSKEYKVLMGLCSNKYTFQKPRAIRIPKKITLKIMEFLYSPSRYVITDRGSKYGTKVKLSKPLRLQEQHTYSLADEVELKIDSIQNQTNSNDKSIKRSCIELTTSVRGLTNVTRKYYSRSQPYKIGVGQQIQIQEASSLNFYSAHCQIYYQKQSWWIKDGSGDDPSILGTFRKLQYKQSLQLQPLSEIYLGNHTILKLDLRGRREEF